MEAQGDGLKYQWYYQNNGATKWIKSGVKDNTYDDVMTIARHNRKLYCVITDAWGNSVTTDPIVVLTGKPTVDLAITKQPTDSSAKIGEKYSISVDAVGDGLTYQWYFRKAGTEKWSKSSVRAKTYSDTLTATRNNREVKCVITDAWGNTVESNIATIRGVVSTELAILEQPVNAYGAKGETISVTVKAQGEGLTYKWYFRNKGATTWSTSSIKSDTYQVQMNSSRANRELKCVITDSLGNKVTTDTVMLLYK